MPSNARVNVLVGADLREFSTKMQNAERQIKKMGRNLQKAGKSLTVGVTAPLVAMGYAATRAFDQQAKAIAQLEAGLKSTGGAVGYTSEQLQKMAADLQNTTLFGDEEILKDATAQLLTFTNIADTQFARTQQAALDLATRLGGDLKSASIQLGKALNDPVANLSALSRSGIQFSTDQKKVINALAKTNRLAEAQTIILDELEKQYGGSAEAAAKAGTGAFTQLGNTIGDLSEDFGKIITEALIPFIDKIKEVAESLKSLPPETKKTIAVVATLAAAIGPLLAVLGFLMTNVIPGLVIAFTSLSGVISSLWTVMLANPITATIAVLAALGVGFYSLSQQIFENVGAMETFWNMLKSGGNVNAFFNLQLVSNAKAVKSQGEAAELAAGLLKKYSFDVAAAGVAAETAAAKIAKVTESLRPVNEGVQSTPSITDLNTGGFQSGFQESVDSNANFGPSLAEVEEMEENIERMIIAQERLQETSQIVGDGVANAFADMANSFLDSLGIADNAFGSFVKSLGRSIIQLIARLLSQAIATSIAGSQTSAAATGPGYIISAPAMMATSIAGVISAFGTIPSFADGGIVSGPTFALVGEYGGASSNPEVIAPLDRLVDLLPTNNGVTDVNVHGVFEIDGRKLRVVLDRTDKQLSRLM